jgi:hypothetical protein
MFEEIAGKNNIDGRIRNAPRFHGVLFDKCHIGSKQLPCLRIQIHSQFLSATQVVDELTVSAAQVQDGLVRTNEPGEVCGDYRSPYAISVVCVTAKPAGV